MILLTPAPLHLETKVSALAHPSKLFCMATFWLMGLAVTSTQRSKAIPDLPTVNEALGIKGYELIAYFASFAPAGTPRDVVLKLNKASNNAAASKEIQERFMELGFEVDPSTPEALAQRSKLETAKWAKAIHDAKIEAQ